MQRALATAVLVLALGGVAPPATAAFVFRIGDVVYVDGTKYNREDWKKLREAPPPTAAAASGPAARAASCVTGIYYEAFPSEDERFQCSAGLGALTREEILQRGWKVDLVEKIPAPAEVPAPARGRELYLYKLVISRDAPRVQPTGFAKPRTDMLCLNDCLGAGATRTFCEDRCTN